jgi:hypothetical protein
MGVDSEFMIFSVEEADGDSGSAGLTGLSGAGRQTEGAAGTSAEFLHQVFRQTAFLHGARIVSSRPLRFGSGFHEVAVNCPSRSGRMAIIILN